MMRFETAGSIGSLVILAVLAFSMYPTDRQKFEASRRCVEEQGLLQHWQTMDLIRDVRKGGEDVAVVVDRLHWVGSPRLLQIAIGKAAYCPIAYASKGGVARIKDAPGDEFARIEDGKWFSKRFPE
jgi:hypothetical protein